MQEIGRMPPVMRRFITRSNVSNISSAVGQAHLIKNHSIVDRSPSPVYLQRFLCLVFSVETFRLLIINFFYCIIGLSCSSIYVILI